jgi:hypothetical protein
MILEIGRQQSPGSARDMLLELATEELIAEATQ